MKNFVWPILVILWLNTFSYAADFAVPEQTIRGSELPIPLGEEADLKISGVNQKPEHLVNTKYDWKAFEIRFDEKNIPQLLEKTNIRVAKLDDGGSNCWFSAGIVNKEIMVLAIITHTYVVKDGEKVTEVATRTNTLTRKVVIGSGFGPGPAPNPIPPGPGPNPVPPTPVVIPDGKWKLGQFSYDNAIKVSSPNRQNTAITFSKNYRGLHASVKAGAIKTIQELLQETQKLNTTSVVGDENIRWKSWASAIEDKVYDLYTNKQLTTLNDFADAWLEIATGLEVVK